MPCLDCARTAAWSACKAAYASREQRWASGESPSDPPRRYWVARIMSRANSFCALLVENESTCREPRGRIPSVQSETTGFEKKRKKRNARRWGKCFEQPKREMGCACKGQPES